MATSRSVVCNFMMFGSCLTRPRMSFWRLHGTTDACCEATPGVVACARVRGLRGAVMRRPAQSAGFAGAQKPKILPCLCAKARECSGDAGTFICKRGGVVFAGPKQLACRANLLFGPLLRLIRALCASNATAVTEWMAASALPLFLRLATLRGASQRVR